MGSFRTVSCSYDRHQTDLPSQLERVTLRNVLLSAAHMFSRTCWVFSKKFTSWSGILRWQAWQGSKQNFLHREFPACLQGTSHVPLLQWWRICLTQLRHIMSGMNIHR